MKNKIYSAATAVFILGAATTMAKAADSTLISIKANIVASPCTISTENLNIDLGDIQASTLETAGSTSPWSGMYGIYLTNCPSSTRSVIARFSGSPASNGDSDGYKNDGTDASISVQLADDEPTPKLLSNGKTETKNVVNNTAEVAVKARLYTSGTAQPGAVKSTINVEFEFK